MEARRLGPRAGLTCSTDRAYWASQVQKKSAQCATAGLMARHEVLFGMARRPDMLCRAWAYRAMLLPDPYQAMPGGNFGHLYTSPRVDDTYL